MKRRDFTRELREAGCYLKRRGKKHDIYPLLDKIFDKCYNVFGLEGLARGWDGWITSQEMVTLGGIGELVGLYCV